MPKYRPVNIWLWWWFISYNSSHAVLASCCKLSQLLMVTRMAADGAIFQNKGLILLSQNMQLLLNNQRGRNLMTRFYTDGLSRPD